MQSGMLYLKNKQVQKDLKSSFPTSRRIKSQLNDSYSNKMNSWLWSQRQNSLYILFIQKNINIFMNDKMRRKKKIFQRMQSFVMTRNVNQCRSHHQKMILKYESQHKIILEFKKMNSIKLKKSESMNALESEKKDNQTCRVQTSSILDQERDIQFMNIKNLSDHTQSIRQLNISLISYNHYQEEYDPSQQKQLFLNLLE